MSIRYWPPKVVTRTLDVTGSAEIAGVMHAAAAQTQWDGGRNVVVGNSMLHDPATDGYLYVPSIDTSPTGTPTQYGDTTPIVVEWGGGYLWLYNYVATTWYGIRIG